MAERAGGDLVTVYAVSPAMRRWRIALVVLGVLVLLIAVSQLLSQIPPTRWIGIAAWLLGALIIHDGVLAFVVLGASVLVRRMKTALPFAVILIAQGAVVVAAIMTILVLPELIKKQLGSANPSILPVDYLGNLGLFYAGVVGAAALAVGIYLGVRMLRARSPRKT